MVKKSKKLLDPLRWKDFLPLKMEGLLTLEDGSDSFSQNVGTELPLNTVISHHWPNI
jgi:hypothetical protein